MKLSIENVGETIVGAIVLFVAAAFLIFAVAQAGIGGQRDGYELIAKFNRVDGLNAGADVMLAGVPVGSVAKIDLNQDYQAVVTLQIDRSVKIPTDSSIRVTSTGLLGSPILAIEPGGGEKMLAAGQEIAITQGSIDLLTLFASFGRQGGEGQAPPAPTPDLEIPQE